MHDATRNDVAIIQRPTNSVQVAPDTVKRKRIRYLCRSHEAGDALECIIASLDRVVALRDAGSIEVVARTRGVQAEERDFGHVGHA